MVQQIGAACLQQSEILPCIRLRQRSSRDDLRAAAVHLQGADGGHQHRHVRLQPGQAALDIPELFEADVGGEAGLGDMVIKQLQPQTVADDRGLADGDVGKGPRVDQHRLMLHRVAQRGVDGVPHPGGHGPGHLQVLGGNGPSLLVIGQHDAADAPSQVLQIPGHGEDSHQLRADRDVGAGIHGIAVHLPLAKADTHLSQGLAAEIQHKAPLHALRIDIQPPQAAFGQRLVVIIALMLHTGIQGGHSQIMGVHNVVDIAGQAQGELRHGNEQGVPAAGGGALYVHGGAAGRLAQTAAHVGTQTSQSLDQAQRRSRLPLAQGRWGNGRYLNILAVRPVLQALHDPQKVQLGGLAIGQQFLWQQTQLPAEPVYRGQGLLRRRTDLPVLVNSRIKDRAPGSVGVGTVFKVKSHAVSSLPHLGMYSRPLYIILWNVVNCRVYILWDYFSCISAGMRIYCEQFRVGMVR